MSIVNLGEDFKSGNVSVPFISDLYGNGFIPRVKKLAQDYLNSKLGNTSKLKDIDIDKLSIYLSNYIIIESEEEFSGEFLEQFEESSKNIFLSTVLDSYISNCIDSFSSDYNLFTNLSEETLKERYSRYVDRIMIQIESYKSKNVEKFIEKYYSEVIRNRVRKYYFQNETVRLDKIGMNVSKEDLIKTGEYLVYLRLHECYHQYKPYQKLLFKVFSTIDLDKLIDDIIDSMEPFCYIEELNSLLFSYDEYKANKEVTVSNIKKIIEFSDDEFDKYKKENGESNDGKPRTRL